MRRILLYNVRRFHVLSMWCCRLLCVLCSDAEPACQRARRS